MGILKDLKNIFFGASSVTKHAAEKASDFIKEEGGEMLDKAKDMATNVGETVLDKADALKDTVMEKGGEMLNQSGDMVEGAGGGILGKANELKDSVTDIGGNILDKTSDKISEIGQTLSESESVNKLKDFTEDVGGKVMETGGELLDKGKDLSENVGEKVLEAKDKLMERAHEAKEQLGEKLNETMDKADAWAEAEKAKPKKEFADDTLDASGSLLEGTDDFFSKADKFASGEYGAFSEGKITISDAESIDKPKFEDQKPATGFTDLDGDGNEIIDDAIIEDPES